MAKARSSVRVESGSCLLLALWPRSLGAVHSPVRWEGSYFKGALSPEHHQGSVMNFSSFRLCFNSTTRNPVCLLWGNAQRALPISAVSGVDGVTGLCRYKASKKQVDGLAQG